MLKFKMARLKCPEGVQARGSSWQNEAIARFLLSSVLVSPSHFAPQLLKGSGVLSEAGDGTSLAVNAHSGQPAQTGSIRLA